MKVLFVSAIMPYPLYSGGQVRIYNLLSRLGKHHEITLVTFLRDQSEKKYEKNLPFCKKIITGYRGSAWQPGYVARSLLGDKPLLWTSYDHAMLRRIIRQELDTQTYDLVHIEPWYVWPSLPPSTIPVVVATHNIEYAVYTEFVRRFRFVPLRPGYYWDVLKLAFWEKYVWKNASHVIAVSDDDAGTIRKKIGSPSQVTVVPNGVDINSFGFVIKRNSEYPVFLFVGSFMWMQNRDAASWLAKDIWPYLRARYKGATLRVVGRGMPDRLRSYIKSQGGILLEHVETIEEEFHNADILLAPIRIGGGTSFKILEAMASGLPVVTTTLGAAGLTVTGGKELMIGNTKEELLSGVEALLSSDKRRTTMVRDGRKKIEKDYVWHTIAKILDRVWYETAKKSS